MQGNLPNLFECNLAVIGLGYVGLPLAVEISKVKYCFRTGKKLSRNIIGFDINNNRISQLKRNIDHTNEISSNQLSETDISFTSKKEELEDVEVFIITVPTPIDKSNMPNLDYIISATTIVANALKNRSKKNTISRPIIIYESTVYPGATEELCINKLEQISGLVLDDGFSCGYSPERINPGDKNKRIGDIIKVTSGSNN